MKRHADEHEFEDWVRGATERLDPFMAWLGVVFALVVGYELAVELTPRSERVLTIVGWGIWAAFLIELLAKLYVAPRRLRFLRRHWFQVAALVLPTLRLLRFLRLMRLGRALPAARVVSSSYRSVGTARRVVRSRLGYLAATAAVVAIATAELTYLFERDAERGIFGSFGDAVIWSFATVVALQADPVPTTFAARVVMLGALTFGLVVVTSLAATLGAYFVDERRERAAVEDPAAP